MGTTGGVAVFRSLLVILCVIAVIPGDTLAYMPPPQQAASSTSTSQTTYPLEIIQLQQWLTNHKNLKDKALADAVAKQSWDPSIQAMAALPDVVDRLANDIKWTTDLGNAFLAQQSDVMDSVQRMHKKAQDKGTLKTTEQQKVETKVVESKQVIVIEQANPEVEYVPSYNPVVVYGPRVYPYYPLYYPGWGYYATGVAISFGVGVMMGAFWSGGWGWGCGWGGNNITINRNNNFNRNTNINRGNRPSNPIAGGGNRGNLGGVGGVGGAGGGGGPGGGGGGWGAGGGGWGGGVGGGWCGGGRGGGGVGGVGGVGGAGGVGGVGGGNRVSTLPSGGGNRWQHNPEHRGGAPYKDRATADRFGGTTRGDSLSNSTA